MDKDQNDTFLIWLDEQIEDANDQVAELDARLRAYNVGYRDALVEVKKYFI